MRAAGLARSGLSIATPMNAKNAAAPTRSAALLPDVPPNRPRTSAMPATPSTTAPEM